MQNIEIAEIHIETAPKARKYCCCNENAPKARKFCCCKENAPKSRKFCCCKEKFDLFIEKKYNPFYYRQSWPFCEIIIDLFQFLALIAAGISIIVVQLGFGSVSVILFMISLLFKWLTKFRRCFDLENEEIKMLKEFNKIYLFSTKFIRLIFCGLNNGNNSFKSNNSI